jgi:DNA (cytosine-5)-methyltransferase 1
VSLTIGSLFSGVGGLDLGLERAGMKVLWQVEINRRCRAVLRRHWPDAQLYEDVRDVGSALAPVDLICGGFPCQDVSVAGRRAGLAGERTGLFHEFVRVARERAPRWLLLENVPGLLSSNGGRDMGTVLGALGKLGYGWTYRVLDLQHFGVPQRRRRVFIVGRLGGVCPPEVLLEPESVSRHPATSGEAGQGVAGGAAPGLAASGRGAARGGEGRGQDAVMLTLTARDAKGPDADSWNIVFHHQASASQSMSPAGTAPALDVSKELSVFGENRCAEVSLMTVWAQLMAGRGKPGQGYAAVFDAAPRRLTPLECERLMGWPDGWTAWGLDNDGRRIDMADGPRYWMCGNGVGTPVAEWIGRRIAAVS